MKQKTDLDIEKFAEEIHRYSALLHEAYEGVIAEGVSKYPAFVFHRQDVTLGIPIADRHTIAGDWSVNISTLEEFYIKGIITIAQVDGIKARISGDPPQYCCLVVGEEKAILVFIATG